MCVYFPPCTRVSFLRIENCHSFRVKLCCDCFEYQQTISDFVSGCMWEKILGKNYHIAGWQTLSKLIKQITHVKQKIDTLFFAYSCKEGTLENAWKVMTFNLNTTCPNMSHLTINTVFIPCEKKKFWLQGSSMIYKILTIHVKKSIFLPSLPDYVPVLVSVCLVGVALPEKPQGWTRGQRVQAFDLGAASPLRGQIGPDTPSGGRWLDRCRRRVTDIDNVEIDIKLQLVWRGKEAREWSQRRRHFVVFFL